MKIFGINFKTKKELKYENLVLREDLESCEDELNYMIESFPFDLGQVVYDLALKNDKGRYTKTKPSLEYSTITEITVTEKNYFSLAERLRSGNVFFDRACAEEHLKSICR